MNLELIDEKNVWVNEDGGNSLVKYLKDIAHYPLGFFLMIIISGKLYWVFNTKEGSVLIDIHNNGNYSGKISIINNSKLHLPDLEFLDVKLGYMCISKTNIYNNNWIPNLTCVVLNTLSQTKPLVIYQKLWCFWIVLILPSICLNNDIFVLGFCLAFFIFWWNLWYIFDE